MKKWWELQVFHIYIEVGMQVLWHLVVFLVHIILFQKPLETDATVQIQTLDIRDSSGHLNYWLVG
jgi:hypothetical protein